MTAIPAEGDLIQRHFGSSGDVKLRAFYPFLKSSVRVSGRSQRSEKSDGWKARRFEFRSF
jgi:hypothetical protein